MENPPWDGTDLGVYEETIINSWVKVDQYDLEIVSLSLPRYKIASSIRLFKNNLTIIIDELKPLFGLRKTGTHTLYIKRKENNRTSLKKYLLLRLETMPEDSMMVKIPTTLKYYDEYFAQSGMKMFLNSFKFEMQAILSFYSICGIQYRKSGIQIRESKYGPYPHSFYVSTMNDDKKLGPISSANIKKWFDCDDLSLVTVSANLVRMLRVNSDNYYEVLDNFTEGFRKIFEKFQSESVLEYWYIQEAVVNLLEKSFPEAGIDDYMNNVIH